MSTLVILGAGGHGRVVADAALAQGLARMVVATDRNPARCAGELVPGVSLRPLEAALSDASARMHVAIGDNGARQRESQALGAQHMATITHPQASVSAHAGIGPGCFIAAQAVVAPGARLGQGVIVNHGAVIDHDCQIGDYCHIAPGATLGGGVTLGPAVLAGSGARILPGLTVCGGAVIGAGAVVLQSLAEPGVYAGVPARRIR